MKMAKTPPAIITKARPPSMYIRGIAMRTSAADLMPVAPGANSSGLMISVSGKESGDVGDDDAGTVRSSEKTSKARANSTKPISNRKAPMTFIAVSLS